LKILQGREATTIGYYPSKEVRTMERTMAFLTVVALLAGATEQSAHAQKGVGDLAGVARQIPKPSLVTLTGTILAVETQPCEKTTGQGRIGSHVLLKTEEGEKLNIHLGWADAVAETAKQLTVGKKISVTAFHTDKLPEGHYIAQSLKFDGKTVQLRDEGLRPEWAGGSAGRGSQPGMGRGRGGGRGAAVDQAKYHRLMADLIEAKAADKPDQAKIDKLTKELQQVQWKEKPGPGPGRGFGWRGGRGGQGPWGDPSFVQDRDMFHYLLGHRDSIQRKVTKLTNGVETVTESDDPEVAATIQRHVESMHKRLEEGRPIHLRDPLFAAIFANWQKITMKVEPTKKGVRVVETSSDAHVAKLIQAHAEVVNLFVANGFAEVPKNHAVPGPESQPRPGP
jgi:hypothetical protein